MKKDQNNDLPRWMAIIYAIFCAIGTPLGAIVDFWHALGVKLFKNKKNGDRSIWYVTACGTVGTIWVLFDVFGRVLTVVCKFLGERIDPNVPADSPLIFILPLLLGIAMVFCTVTLPLAIWKFICSLDGPDKGNYYPQQPGAEGTQAQMNEPDPDKGKIFGMPWYIFY